MTRRRLPVLLVAAFAWAGGVAPARAEDAPAAVDARLVEHPDDPASDPRDVRRAAEDVLEGAPRDERALAALLAAVGRLGDADLLDDAIERARPADAPALSLALGRALLLRARLDEPPDVARLREAATRLAPAATGRARARDALDLAYARHLLGERDGALAAYGRALDDDEATAELALRGAESLLHADPPAYDATLATWTAARPRHGPLLRAQAERLATARGAAAAIAFLGADPARAAAPRTAVRLAAWLREEERHAEALALERRALAEGGSDLVVVDAIEVSWRQARPLASFADTAALEADVDALLARVERDPWRALAFRNDFAFRLRDVAASFAWRGEGRTQGIAAGAPKEARALLDRVVRLYDEAVAAIPAEAASMPFERRWVYAGVLNDAALMRHYWVDVRDLERAQALYLRAFDLTDGAYTDTYDYNLQYLFGFERPGQDDLWFRLARRASEAILKEVPGRGFVPDEGKREAARRDAEALRRTLDARGGAR